MLAETKAAGTAKSVTGKENIALRRVIAKKIAAGVKSEQIIASMQSLGNPANCREIARHDVAVATPLYAGPESKITLFVRKTNIPPGSSYPVFDQAFATKVH